MSNERYNVIRLEQVDSTNNYGKTIARDGAVDRTVVVAERQTAGRGRLGRKFESDGSGLYMSIILRPHLDMAQVNKLTLVAAVAVRKALFMSCGLEGFIKWPNDIVADGKKICGILTEMSAVNTTVNFVVVGIGININDDSFPEELSDKAASVKMMTGKQCDKDEIMYSVLREFEGYYNSFEKNGDLSAMMDEYSRFLINKGEKVRIVNGDDSFEGVCMGVDSGGELLVKRQLADNTEEIVTVISGDVSVRGVYGYV